MTAIPTERPVALAVKAALEAELGAGLVGYGVKPATGGWQVVGTPDPSSTPFKGYAVLYPGQTAPLDGPADGASFDGQQGWQVTSVGATAEQADAIRDRCRVALLTARLTVAGRWCDPTQLADGLPVQRDDDVTPPVFYAVDRFTCYTTPA